MKGSVKFRQGADANKMLLRKLLKNFIVKGKIITTRKKAKFLKSNIERVMIYAKKDSQATQNKLRSALADTKVEILVKKQVAPVFKDKTSGFTKITYLPKRLSDSSDMARLEWSLPVVIEEEKEESEKKPKKADENRAAKQTNPKKEVHPNTK